MCFDFSNNNSKSIILTENTNTAKNSSLSSNSAKQNEEIQWKSKLASKKSQRNFFFVFGGISLVAGTVVLADALAVDTDELKYKNGYFTNEDAIDEQDRKTLQASILYALTGLLVVGGVICQNQYDSLLTDGRIKGFKLSYTPTNDYIALSYNYSL